MPPTSNLQILDPVYLPKPHLNLWERFLSGTIRDLRDLPFLKLSLRAILFLVPGALWLFLWPQFYWPAAILYWLTLFTIFLGPYVLMLHNFSHRPLFKRKYRYLEFFLVWGLGPLCGQTPETYFAHHIAMHHVEENLLEDLSSTMTYRRDSFWDFTRYFVKFFFFGFVAMIRYLHQRNRRKLLYKMIIGEISWYLLVTLLCFFHWEATVTVFIVPLIVTRFMMINGNWAQHAFVDQKFPEDPYTSSITCINSRYNRTCFNDGYHIGHHIKANRHWTDMPGDFLNNHPQYFARRAIVFEKLDYFQIWLCLMFKRYGRLAKHFVNLDPNHSMNQDEIITLLKSRVMPIPSR